MYSIKNDYWQETVNENWLENFTNTMIRIKKYYLKQNMYHDWTNYVHLHVISSQAKVSLFCLLEIQKANYRFKIKKDSWKKKSSETYILDKIWVFDVGLSFLKFSLSETLLSQIEMS